MKFLNDPIEKYSEEIAEMLRSDQPQKVFAGSIVQTSVKFEQLKAIGEQIKKQQEADEVLNEFLNTEKRKQIFIELLRAVDETTPEEELFRAMKSIFLTSIQKNSTQAEEFLAYEFFQTAKKLSGTEILILKASNEVKTVSTSADPNQLGFQMWALQVAQHMGYGDMYSIVEKYDDNLTSLKLFTGRMHQDLSGVRLNNHSRLTSMGKKFCEFVIKYP